MDNKLKTAIISSIFLTILGCANQKTNLNQQITNNHNNKRINQINKDIDCIQFQLDVALERIAELEAENIQGVYRCDIIQRRKWGPWEIILKEKIEESEQ